MISVVVINGGRGAGSLLPALQRRRNIHLTSVINAYDDGKSTGEVRRHFSMLGPSDIRKVQELLLPDSDNGKHWRVLFSYRYPVSSPHDAVIEQLQRFADGGCVSPIVDPALDPGPATAALRVFVRCFLDHLRISEKIIGSPFDFSDCSLMNCVYGGAFLYFERDLERAVEYINQLFEVEGRVLVAGVDNKHLAALREDGGILYSEADIVEQRSSTRIRKLVMLDAPLLSGSLDLLNDAEQSRYLASRHRPGTASQQVQNVLRDADIIVYAPGTQHSSLYPTYLLRGVADAIGENRKALKVFVTNIGADFETPDYVASDYINGAFQYLTASTKARWTELDLFTHNLVNDGCELLESAVPVDIDGLQKVPAQLLLRPLMAEGGAGRHDGERLTDIVIQLYREQLELDLQ